MDIEEKNLHDLAKVLKKLNADSLPLDILVGSLLETGEAFQQKKDIITKNWQTKGKDFLEADKKNNSNSRGNSSHPFRNSQQKTESAVEAHEKDL